MEIKNRQGQTTTATFVLGETIVQTKFMDNLGGMPLQVGWLLVVVDKIDCPPSHYLDVDGFTCKICLPPTASMGGSALECGICEAGYYMTDLRICEKCPEGATCDGSSSTATLVLDPGYWRISTKSTDIFVCPWNDGCKGGANISSYCEDGHFGILCTYCILVESIA